MFLFNLGALRVPMPGENGHWAAAWVAQTAMSLAFSEAGISYGDLGDVPLYTEFERQDTPC